MSDDITSLSAVQLIEHYRTKRLSPVEAVKAALARIEKLQPIYNAFVLVDEESALRAARESEARWQKGTPLGLVDGVPSTVKDLILTKGWPTRRGSRTVDPNQPWEEDGASVARMREQGAIFLGKTTTPEFGWKGVTDSPLTGTTCNPWDTRMTPGGSSGGAAVASALGMGALHIATDGGGSIRIPAGFCGLFGFKATWGVVPCYPHSLAFTLWHQGPISRTVADAALMLNVISKPDVRDPYQARPSDIDYCSGQDGGVKGLRIAYSPTLGYAKVDPEVAALVERGVKRFSELGAHVEEIHLELEDPIAILQPMWEVAMALGVAPMTPEQRALCDQPMLAIADAGMRLSAVAHRQAERQREAFARRMLALHEKYDLLVTPQLATTAFAVNHEVPPNTEMKRWWQWSPFTYAFNLTQQPAATMPCGFATNGLPVAMQLVGTRFADSLVLRAARAYEKAHPIETPQLKADGKAVRR